MSSGTLQELVWRTGTGLGVRYAETSSERKTPVLWDTELFSLIVSPPLHNGEGASNKDKDYIDLKLEPARLKPNPEIKYLNEGSTRRSNKRSYGHFPRSRKDMELSYKLEKAISDHTVSKKVEGNSFSQRNNETSDDILDNVDTVSDKDLIPDNDSRRTDSLPSNLEKLRQDRAEVGHSRAFGNSSGHHREQNTLVTSDSPMKSRSSATRSEQDRIIQCSVHEESGFEDARSGVAKGIDTPEKGELGIPASIKDKILTKLGDLLNKHVELPPHSTKGKSVIAYNSGDSERHSEVRDKFDTGVEGSSYDLMLSKRKRARSFYANAEIKGKKHKTQSNGNYFADSTCTEGSSFMISTIMSGFGSDHAASPQPSHSSQKPPSLLTSHGENKGTYYSGLLSTCQTLYHSSATIRYNIHGKLDHLIEDDFTGNTHVSREQFDSGRRKITSSTIDASLDNAVLGTKALNEILEHGSLPIISQGKGNNFDSVVHISARKLIPGSFPFEESPSVTLTNKCKNHETSEASIGEYPNLPYLKSPSTFAPCDSDSTKGRESDTTSFLPKSITSLMTDNTRSLKSLWITRLSPKFSTFVSDQVLHNQENRETNISLNMATDPPFPGDLTSTKNNIVSGRKESSLQGQRIAAGGEFKVSSIFHTGSFASKEIDVNQKHATRMDDILPSQYERFQSIDVSNDAPWADTTCFFCGKSTHGLGECSELVESHGGK